MSLVKSQSSDNPKKKPKDMASSKEKKPSKWSWKRLKALTSNIRNRRFNCIFSLIVHSIDDLPPYFDDLYLVVHWKRREAELMTHPIQVHQGEAKFEEQLAYSCSVYGNRSGPDHTARYEPKHFLLYASVYDAPDLNLGSHRVDLTRLLPLTLDELEEKSTGTWTTSFKLMGEAAGARMNVSFGYVVAGNNNGVESSSNNVPEILSLREGGEKTEKFMRQSGRVNEGVVHRAGSLPDRLSVHQSAENVKDLHEVLPTTRSDFCESVQVLYQKLDEGISSELNSITPPYSGEKISNPEWDIKEFTIVDKGIEDVTKEQVKLEDPPEVAQASGSGEVLEAAGEHCKDALVHPPAEEPGLQKDKQLMSTCKEKEDEKNETCFKESLSKELETALSYTKDLIHSLEDEDDTCHLNHCLDVISRQRDRMKGKSFSMNDISFVARDSPNMLETEYSPFTPCSESEPESPRERLLREFENDAFANGGLLNIDIKSDSMDFINDTPTGSLCSPIPNNFHQLSMSKDLEDLPKIKNDALKSKLSASKMEDLESKALMHDGSINKTAFLHSPPNDRCGLDGSPVNVPTEDHQQLPSLAEGWGPFLQTKSGGLLRTMNPAPFKNAKNGGNLIMQVSQPVVVPAEMGAGVMDILQRLAAMGIEKLSIQANKLMPLEDITGKSIQQISWEAAPCPDGAQSFRQGLWQHSCETTPNMQIERKSHKGKSSCMNGSDTEYITLDGLAPLAMDKIEALSIEGLRIQSGMPDKDAPSNIITQSMGEFSALKAKSLESGGLVALDGADGLQLVNTKDDGEDIDRLMALSLSFDEWMKLNSGEIDGNDELFTKPTSKLLAAHHASSLDLCWERSKDKRQGRGRQPGLLGNNFTIALMVQLHDPSRNYEPVGSRMLALIQVESVFIPPKHKICTMVLLPGNSNDEEEDEPTAARKENALEKPKVNKTHEELIPQFKITVAHVAGLKAVPGKKLWGSKNQQKSGSRWLLANGMGKKYKHPLMKSRPVIRNSGTAQLPRDLLWSISSSVHGTGEQWKEVAGLKSTYTES